jgi:hypothetical protein
MTREQKYDLINSQESLKGLAAAIRSFAEADGMIQGRTRRFDAEKMAKACLQFRNYTPNVLTREFGIRQQAMYIVYYEGPAIRLAGGTDMNKQT